MKTIASLSVFLDFERAKELPSPLTTLLVRKHLFEDFSRSHSLLVILEEEIRSLGPPPPCQPSERAIFHEAPRSRILNNGIPPPSSLTLVASGAFFP